MSTHCGKRRFLYIMFSPRGPLARGPCAGEWCLSACPLVHLPVCLSVCLSFCESACLLACLPACLSVCLFVCLSVCRPACLPACLFVCLSVCLSVCLCCFSLTGQPRCLAAHQMLMSRLFIYEMARDKLSGPPTPPLRVTAFYLLLFL